MDSGGGGSSGEGYEPERHRPSGVHPAREPVEDRERDPAGLPEDIAIDACAVLAGSGLIDYVSVTTGTSATLAGSGHIVPEMTWRAGYTAPAARRMKDAVTVPVLVAGRINQPQDAELILRSGDADACIMTRALICDPVMPALAAQGRTGDIRACIACNQACIGHFHAGYPISCIQHPETGRELRYGRRTPAARRRTVLVAGGGPAGMKAATVAAERGHRVVLHEATGRLGGQILLAERLPGRAEFGGAATNLQSELTRANVTVALHSRVTPRLVREHSPDLVIVATGARPYRPPLEIDGTGAVGEPARSQRAGALTVPGKGSDQRESSEQRRARRPARPAPVVILQ